MRARGFKTDWSSFKPAVPKKLGLTVFDDYDLEELAAYIDWTPFFQTWEMKGRYPDLLDDPNSGPPARALLADAQAMLKRMIKERWVRARGVVGLWPANASGDDIIVYADETRSKPLATFHTLRQQMAKEPGRANFALSDYVAPVGAAPDYIGGFAVTTGHGEEAYSVRFKADHDDYSSILLKSLTDRLAEAFAERMHERVRRELWGYAPDEQLTPQAIIEEAYRGIRPAPGYPAQPDHTEKRTLFSLLDAPKNAGIELTESCAMWPGSSVSGLYFSHPESAYFGVGKIERDQAEDYAARKGMSLGEIERWLAPNLNYRPR